MLRALLTLLVTVATLLVVNTARAQESEPAAAGEGDTLHSVNAVSRGGGLLGLATALASYFTTPSPSDQVVSVSVDVGPPVVSLPGGGMS